MNRYEAASEAVRTPKTPSRLWEPRLRIPPNLKGQTVTIEEYWAWFRANYG